MAIGYSREHDPANDVDVDDATQTLGTDYSTRVPDQSGTYLGYLPVASHPLPANDAAALAVRQARKFPFGRKIAGRSPTA